jgi:polar amino acid transport system permease protein
MVAGFALNALRLAFGRAFALPYGAFIWLIRGTPYLSQLVIVYFGLPMIGVTMSAVEATVVSLALYASAYLRRSSAPRGPACRAASSKRPPRSA